MAVVALAFQACSHLDPYEKYPQSELEIESAKKDVRLLRPEFAPLAGNFNPNAEFSGSVPNAMAAVDQLHLALAKTLHEMDEERSIHEGSVWALAPFILADASRSGESIAARNRALGLTAMLTSWGSFLSRRPPGYEEAYANGVHRLACLIADARQHLYRNDELPLSKEGRLSEALRKAIDEYEMKTRKAMAVLKDTKPTVPGRAPCAVEKSLYCADRRALLAKGGGDPTLGLEKTQLDIDSNLRVAKRRLADVKELEDKVEFGAASELREKSLHTMKIVGIDLRSSRPEISTLKDAFATLAESNKLFADAVAKAQSSGDASEQPNQLRSVSLPGGFRGWGRKPSTPTDQITLRSEWETAEEALFSAMGKTDGLADMKKRKQAEAKVLTSALQCRASVSDAAAPPASAAASGIRQLGASR